MLSRRLHSRSERCLLFCSDRTQSINIAGYHLFSLEVDDSVFSSASASAVSYSDFTLVVTTGVFLQGYYQRFLRRASS